MRAFRGLRDLGGSYAKVLRRRWAERDIDLGPMPDVFPMLAFAMLTALVWMPWEDDLPDSATVIDQLAEVCAGGMTALSPKVVARLDPAPSAPERPVLVLVVVDIALGASGRRPDPGQLGQVAVSRRTKINPPPMKPMPETICAATRDGSSATWSVLSRSKKPYFDTSMKTADPTPTKVCVRSPALFALISRSNPIAADSTSASTSGSSSDHCAEIE